MPGKILHKCIIISPFVENGISMFEGTKVVAVYPLKSHLLQIISNKFRTTITSKLYIMSNTRKLFRK